MRWTLACVSDLHAGSTLGLHPKAGTTLDDGGTYHPNKTQRWLWEKWLDYWKQVSAVRADKLAILLNGDLVDGDHHGTTQLVSGNEVVQADICRAILEPAFALQPDHIIITRGTEAHVGGSAKFEESLAKTLADKGLPIVKHGANYTWWHFVGRFGKITVDMAHHANMGGRNWTGPNACNLHAADLFYEHAKHGRPHPHLALRAHAHRSGDSQDAHPIRYIAMPAWQTKTAFGHKIAAGKFADIGGVIVQAGDALEARRVMYPPDPAPVWEAA